MTMNDVSIYIEATSHKVSRSATVHKYIDAWNMIWQWFDSFKDNYETRIKRRRAKNFSVSFDFVVKHNGFEYAGKITKSEEDLNTLSDYYDFVEWISSLQSEHCTTKATHVTELHHTITSMGGFIDIVCDKKSNKYYTFQIGNASIVRIINVIHHTDWSFYYTDTNGVWHYYSMPMITIHDTLWEGFTNSSNKTPYMDGIYRLCIRDKGTEQYIKDNKSYIITTLSNYLSKSTIKPSEQTSFVNLINQLSKYNSIKPLVKKVIDQYTNNLTNTISFIEDKISVAGDKNATDDTIMETKHKERPVIEG